MPIVDALRLRCDPSASDTLKIAGDAGAPTWRASEGGMMLYVAPVSTRKRALALRRAYIRASTYT
jgi:hypothetical protein